MVGILSVETSGDSCSVALMSRAGEIRQLHEYAPRRHNQILFEMIRELLPPGPAGGDGIDCLAFGAGPGSFTGLRIAASAVQGLAYSYSLAVAPVSTLAILAQGALRNGIAAQDSVVFATIDARIGEIYCGLYRFEGGLPVALCPDWVSKPEALALPADPVAYTAVGDGLEYLASFPAEQAQRLAAVDSGVSAQAQDALPLALNTYEQQNLQSAADVVPVYVRDEISWKKLSEQGKRG